jgi:FG-GAP-like repeat
VAAGDLNGDGKLDLAVVVKYGSTGGITVLLGNGDGTFQVGGTFAANITGYLNATPALADLNRDGRPDLAFGYYAAPSGLAVLLGRGDGTFVLPRKSALQSLAPNRLLAVDLNGDGKLDLAVSSTGNRVVLFRGDGTGVFTYAGELGTDPSPTFVIGTHDLLTCNTYGRVSALTNLNKPAAADGK